MVSVCGQYGVVVVCPTVVYGVVVAGNGSWLDDQSRDFSALDTFIIKHISYDSSFTYTHLHTLTLTHYPSYTHSPTPHHTHTHLHNILTQTIQHASHSLSLLTHSYTIHACIVVTTVGWSDFWEKTGTWQVEPNFYGRPQFENITLTFNLAQGLRKFWLWLVWFLKS